MVDQLRPNDPGQIGPYRVVGRIGAGGMGVVYLARSTIGRLVAVKVIRPELADDLDFQARFRREVAAARRVNGLYTAPVVDADTEGAVQWLATAYVPGPSLRAAVQRHGPLPVRSVLALAAGLAEGLGAVHAAGLVHRCVTPNDVLLAADGPRLIDFGIALDSGLTTITDVGTIVGVPVYMSPEQSRGEPVGPPSDMFSLGGVLVYAAAGRPPFGEESATAVLDITEILDRVQHQEPDLTGVAAEVRPIAAWCLAKDPAARPTPQQLLGRLGDVGLGNDWLPAALLADIPAVPIVPGGPPATSGEPERPPHEKAPATVAGMPSAPFGASLESQDPREVGGFRVLRRLGSGGMGRVYLAESSRTGRLAAIKILHTHLAYDPTFRNRFRLEVEAARRVSGTHTAAVLDAGPEANPPWLATVYVSGPTLEEMVRDHSPLAEDAVRDLGVALAEGLADIHACGLVHRDLKPGNVIMADDGPRIIDFGIARDADTDHLTDTGGVVGTYPYMAPERFHGTAGPESDVFALGAVLAYASTGRSPFEAPSMAVTMRRILETPPDLDGVPESLRTLVAACLDKDPDRRPSLRDLLDALTVIPADAEEETAERDPARGAVSVDRSAGVQVGDGNVQYNFYGQGYDSARPVRRPGDGNPYRGLSSFGEADQELFFGRDDAILDVMGRLSSDGAGLVVVSGTAVAGKTSLLYAGILPRLSRHGLPIVAEARQWPRIVLTPGAAPLDELAAQVAALAGGSAAEVRKSLATDPGRLGLLARQAVLRVPAVGDPLARPRLLLAVDQFEQVFTLCKNEGERRAFIDALSSAAMEEAALVLLVVRADFENQCAWYPQLANAIADRYRLKAMTERELELAITEPARRAGAQVERALVDRLLADVEGRPDALPRLSYALAECWQLHTGDTLTVADYERSYVESEVVTGDVPPADPIPGSSWRVFVDLRERDGNPLLVVTDPRGLYSERRVAWRRLPEYRGAAGWPLLLAEDDADSSDALLELTALVDAGDVWSAALQRLYGVLLFQAAFGPEGWRRLRQAANGLPIELAILGPASDDLEALQSLHWEALHDGTEPLTAPRDLGAGDMPGVTIVRVLPDRGRTLSPVLAPIDRIPRVLIATDDPATDTGVFDTALGSVRPRVLASATPAAIREELAIFQPDVLYLAANMRSDSNPAPGEHQMAAAWLGGAWVSVHEMVHVLVETAHVPRLVILQDTTQLDGLLPVAGSQRFAARLVAAGIPAAVTMAGMIADDAARHFNQVLLASLAQGQSFVQAVALGNRAALVRQRPDWLQPPVILDEQCVDTDPPLVVPGLSRAVEEVVSRLGLAGPESALVGRGEFERAMDRLLDDRDPLNVLLSYAPNPEHGADGMRLLRQLAAYAVRLGVMPVLLGPFDHDPPTSFDQLADELSDAIDRTRERVGLPHVSSYISNPTWSSGDSKWPQLGGFIRVDLDTLVRDLREADSVPARTAGEPKTVLLCHAVNEWREAFSGLVQMLGPTGLSGGRTPVPVVLSGTDVGDLQAARLGEWAGVPWLRAIPLADDGLLGDQRESDPEGIEWLAERAEIRALVAGARYQEAEGRVGSLAAADPRRAVRAWRELGFVTLPDPDRRVIATAWLAAAAGHDVQSLLVEGDNAAPELLEPPADASMPARPAADALAADAPAPRRSAQQSGAALEQATVDLFKRFFAVDPDTLVSRLRRQGAGTKFGHDIELDCAVADRPTVRCHVECKNLDRRVTVNDIGGKLAQQKFHHRDAQVDHWILISPHHDVSDELRVMLDTWDEQDEYPFSVQVWSPENGVREMFALEPAVFEAVYGRPPAAEETAAAAAAAPVLRERLAPRLRVDRVWRTYTATPGALCFVNEDARHFDALYGGHLPLRAADERGALLDGTLMDQVTSWARDRGSSPMLLLADFGEGKSVFTYCLTRRLCEQFRAAPDDGILPLRIPLREFREAGSARGLLQRRLGEFEATFADWRRLSTQVRTLAILDGFDEMSADLSPAAVTANLNGVTACLTELSGSKVLVTSRQRVLDGTRDWNRTLDRLRRPQIMRIGSGSRRQRVQYLEQFATDEASTRVLANLRSLYDPIGLAAKPLFLEMIKETLRDLPADTFSETILYDTYIDKSLRTKPELLVDPDGLLTSDELVENLKDILADVALRLQERNAAFLYLRDYYAEGDGKIAETLWKMRDQAAPREPFDLAAHDDAANRVGTRSLLKGVPAPLPEQWPVDFFHRSMREYFVARAIVHSLSTDQDRARRFLGAVPLLPEITHFAGTILRERPDQGALDALEAMARSAKLGAADGPGYLGGNALTLLYAARGELPNRDWSGLRLDHAKLRGADLHGSRFAGSSLRYANLDNANLEDADLTGADLEGVRLEETSQVLAVTSLGGNRIVAAYEDGSLREWRGQPGAGWESQVVAMLDHKADSLQLSPLGRVVAAGYGALTVLDGFADDAGGPDGRVGGGGAASVRCEFPMNSRCRALVLGSRTALVAAEADGGRIRVTWLDLATARALDTLEVDASVTACAQLDGKLYSFATPGGIHVVWGAATGARGDVLAAHQGVTCLAVRSDGASGVLLAAGHRDGSVSLMRVSPAEIGAPLWRRQLHEGPVTSVVLDAEERVITGGTDRSVCVAPVAGAQPDAAAPVERLQLTLRCQNVRFDGVRTEREQAKLREYAQYLPAGYRILSVRTTHGSGEPGASPLF